MLPVSESIERADAVQPSPLAQRPRPLAMHSGVALRIAGAMALHVTVWSLECGGRNDSEITKVLKKLNMVKDHMS